jgi:hypothetical protein
MCISKKQVVTFVILISAIFLPIYAQASGTVSSAIITEGFATHFTTIW